MYTRPPLDAGEEVPSRAFGPYRLLDQVAEGGMGRVHLARRSGTADFCVLKLLLQRFEGTAEVGRRFRREAHLVSFLDDPHIARVLDAGSHEGVFYIAFELIEGHSLAELLSRLSKRNVWLPPEAAVRVAVEALDGLAHAHERVDPEGEPLGLVHRDLSPANLMISYRGEVKIIDFGIATAQVDDFRTLPGRFLGTLRYMSPEQVASGKVDARSDLYTLAVVLWEMLARRRMVPKQAAPEMIETILRGPPLPLAMLAPRLPPALLQVVDRALAKAPEERFQTARELRDALLDSAVSLERYTSEQLAELVSTHFAAEREHLEAKLDRLRNGVSVELNPDQHAETKVHSLPELPLAAPTVEMDWSDAILPVLEAAETVQLKSDPLETKVIAFHEEVSPAPLPALLPGPVTARPSPTPGPKLQTARPPADRRERRVSRLARWVSVVSLLLVLTTVGVEVQQRRRVPASPPPANVQGAAPPGPVFVAPVAAGVRAEPTASPPKALPVAPTSTAAQTKPDPSQPRSAEGSAVTQGL